MFSTLYRFMIAIRERSIANDRLTLIQHRDAEFASMSRSGLLKLRDACYATANSITEYLCWLDSEPVVDDNGNTDWIEE
jgi:hypothetical protein